MQDSKLGSADISVVGYLDVILCLSSEEFSSEYSSFLMIRWCFSIFLSMQLISFSLSFCIIEPWSSYFFVFSCYF